MDVQGFHHLAIQVTNLEVCSAFYRDVLGLPELTRHFAIDGTLRSIWHRVGEGFLAIERASESARPPTLFRHGAPGLHLVALRIRGADRTLVREALLARQIRIEHETRWTLYVRDPEGNRVGLSHHPADP
ncbi:MAG: VOC family protein [Myxococcaceae bacterium]